MSALEAADIQGIVLFGYGSLRYARYVHVAFGAEGRPGAWLEEARGEIAGGARSQERYQERVQLAFTYAGLARLGLGKSELESFPRELRQGMGSPLRARVNGDQPENWAFGGPNNAPIHALLMLYAHAPEALRLLRDRLVERLETHGGAVVHEDVAELSGSGHEHFGFRDGISQPTIAGGARAPRSDEVEVPAGEFVLGYPNAYREVPASPRGGDGFDLGKNGSYLVYRKLGQDTAGFWRSMLERAEPRGDPQAATKLATTLVGRWPSGAPLVRYPHADPGASGEQEAFGFAAEDPEGLKCPLGAHVRRANPRDMLLPAPGESLRSVARHRLLRRGRPYGPPAPRTPLAAAQARDAERGLVFIALNASFRRQFEHVQQTWLNNPKFGGLFDERDPLVGAAPAGGQSYTIPALPARRRVQGIRPFVALLGGGYFFLPGRSALAWMAKRR